MLSDKQKNLIMSVINNNPLRSGKISDNIFFREYPVKDGSIERLISSLINEALQEKDAVGVEYAMYLGAHFGFSKEQKKLLILLLDSPDHRRHDDVVRALDLLKLKDDDVVDALYRGANSKFEYLKEDRADGNYMLNWNCIFSLAKIGNNYSIKKLENLLDCNVENIRAKVLVVMRKYGFKEDYQKN